MSNSQAYNPLPFQRFSVITSLQASKLQSAQASIVKGLVILKVKCGLRSQSLYFLYLSHPPEAVGKEENDPTTNDRTKKK